MKPEQIKRLRTSIYHLDQPSFAQLMGCGVATVSRWERGATKPPGLNHTLLQACQQAVDLHGEARIRGVDWPELLRQQGLLKVMAAILNFATMPPAGTAEPTTDGWNADVDAEDEDDLGPYEPGGDQ